MKDKDSELFKWLNYSNSHFNQIKATNICKNSFYSTNHFNFYLVNK